MLASCLISVGVSNSSLASIKHSQLTFFSLCVYTKLVKMFWILKYLKFWVWAFNLLLSPIDFYLRNCYWEDLRWTSLGLWPIASCFLLQGVQLTFLGLGLASTRENGGLIIGVGPRPPQHFDNWCSVVLKSNQSISLGILHLEKSLKTSLGVHWEEVTRDC